MKKVTVLIPTYNRLTALTAVLTSLLYQTYKDFNIYVSDQSEKFDLKKEGEIQALKRIFATKFIDLKIFKNSPCLGMAHQRACLFEKSKTKYTLFLDDDLILESFVLEGMVSAIEEENCGFVGRAVIGLSYKEDARPSQQRMEFWEGKVEPEKIAPGGKKWQRFVLHNAANIYHLEEKLKIRWPNQKKYKIAWVGGCTLFDTQKLKSVGGFDFWQDLPKRHSGEDVLAQLRVMKKYGGCGLIPSGVYHLELNTTIPERVVNAPEVLKI